MLSSMLRRDAITLAKRQTELLSAARAEAGNFLLLMVSTACRTDRPDSPPGMVIYLRYPDGSDALIRVDTGGQLVSQSLSAIFRAITCAPGTPAVPLAENHYDLIQQCVHWAMQEQTDFVGRLGSRRSARRKLYEQLRRYRDTLSDAALREQLDLIWRSAQEAISRQMHLGISNQDLLELVIIAWKNITYVR